MKLLQINKKQISFPKEREINKGLYYVPYIKGEWFLTPDKGLIKIFEYKKTYDDSISTEWFRLSDKFSIRNNGKMVKFVSRNI